MSLYIKFYMVLFIMYIPFYVMLFFYNIILKIFFLFGVHLLLLFPLWKHRKKISLDCEPSQLLILSSSSFHREVAENDTDVAIPLSFDAESSVCLAVYIFFLHIWRTEHFLICRFFSVVFHLDLEEVLGVIFFYITLITTHTLMSALFNSLV